MWRYEAWLKSAGNHHQADHANPSQGLPGNGRRGSRYPSRVARRGVVACAPSCSARMELEQRRSAGDHRRGRPRLDRLRVDDHRRQPHPAHPGPVRLAWLCVDCARSAHSRSRTNLAKEGVQRAMTLLCTRERTARDSSVYTVFPPVLNCPAAIFAAFSWGWFVHPLRPTPRSLNVVSITRCGSEGGIRRRGIGIRRDLSVCVCRGNQSVDSCRRNLGGFFQGNQGFGRGNQDVVVCCRRNPGCCQGNLSVFGRRNQGCDPGNQGGVCGQGNQWCDERSLGSFYRWNQGGGFHRRNQRRIHRERQVGSTSPSFPPNPLPTPKPFDLQIAKQGWASK